MQRDPRVDAYIEAAAPFARPILSRLREGVHRACPEATETIRWGLPHFEHRGILCSMAAFRAHCCFGFWKGSLVVGDTAAVEEAMGHLGRIGSLEDLPDDAGLERLVRRAAELNERGVRAERATKAARRAELPLPDDLRGALERGGAMTAWERFAPSHRREYLAWVEEAKRPETRARRVATTAEWVAEGRSRNWKYERPGRGA
jgi:hypothetical protein